MSRIDQLREAMKKISLNAMLVTSHYNLRYLTNFTGTTGLALITQNNAYFVTDFRYMVQAAKQAVGFEIVKNVGPIFEKVNELLKENQIELVGFESSQITFDTYDQLSELFDADLVPITGMIEKLREIKSEDEIQTIKQACEIADKGYAHILNWIKPGQTEIQVANELDFYMRSLGATSVSFDTIVASGYRSAMPHGVASEKVIGNNELVTIDFGCYYQGYVSDVTRTFAIGDPGPELKKIYDIVLEAQLAVIQQVKPGITGKEVDSAARNVIIKHGYGDAFGHGTYHGIGLEIHEGPIGTVSPEKFSAGTIITDEPGIYLAGKGGVRIEDDLLITTTGNEILVHSPKNELIIL